MPTKHGFYKGTDESFSFSDVYNPLSFGGARFCDARVWSFFRKINQKIRDNQDYTNYAMGKFTQNTKLSDQSPNPNGYVSNQTGYSFVAQSRGWLPAPIGGIFWFGVDDADGCIYAPMYYGITKIPESYAIVNGSMITWSETSAYWTFSQVNNWAYSRYNIIHPDVHEIHRWKCETYRWPKIAGKRQWKKYPDSAITARLRQ